MTTLLMTVLMSVALTIAREIRDKELQSDNDGYSANANSNPKAVATQDNDGNYLGNGLGSDDDALHGSYGCRELQDISIEIYVAHGQVEMTMKGPQGEWFGFGFGSYRMEGTYAIIAGDGTVSDYFLSKNSDDQSDTKIDDAMSCLTVLSDESDGFYRTIRLQRPRDHPDTFSFPSNVGNYPIISAKAVYKTHEMSYHGQNRRQENFEFSRVGNYAYSRSGSFSHSASGSWSHSASGSGSWSASGSGSHSADGSHSGLFHHPHYDHRPGHSGSHSHSHSHSASGSHSFSASGSHSFSASGSGSHSASGSGSHSASGSGSQSYGHSLSESSESVESSHPMGSGCCVSNDDADVRGRYQFGVFRPLKCHEAYERDVCVSLLSGSGADRCLWKHGPECYEDVHRQKVIADEEWEGPKGECVWNGQSELQSTNAQSPLAALSDAAKWEAQCSALSEAECVTGGPYTHCLWVGFAHLGDLEKTDRTNNDAVSISDDHTHGATNHEDQASSSFGCVWDETGSGNTDRMLVQCERLSESECIASQNNNKDARCTWKALSHLEREKTLSAQVNGDVGVGVDAQQLMNGRHAVAVFSGNMSTLDVVLALCVMLTIVAIGLVVRVWAWSECNEYEKLAQSSPDTEPLLMNKV